MADEYFRLYSLDRQIDDMITDEHDVSTGKKPGGPLSFFFDKKITIGTVKRTQDSIKSDMTTLLAAIEECRKTPSSCAYSKNTPTTDVDYRRSLPVHNGAVKSWNDLQAATSALKSLQFQLANTKKFIPIFSLGRVPNPTFQQLSDQVVRQSKIVDNIGALMDSTSERYWLWIDLPTHERCKNGEVSTCLNNAQLDQVRQSM